MRSQSIKARSRRETSLAVLLIKTDRFRPGYEAHITDLAQCGQSLSDYLVGYNESG